MSYQDQVPRNALAWIITAQFALLLPHMARVPLWVVVVYLVSACWRIMVYQGRWSFPGPYVKSVLAITCFAGVYYHYSSLIGLEPTVALLLTAFALKLIELHDRRDGYVALFLAYFVCVTEFLFSQDLLVTLYMLFAVLVITSALVALHQPGEDAFTSATLKRAGVMLAQAFPLMLVLFFVFPRIGPLWSVPLKSNSAKSGMSDFMSPGDVSSLSLSDEVAFRVQFDGEIPPRRELYWRGLVFSSLDDGSWRSLRWSEVPVLERRQQRPPRDGEPLKYSVIMEPTNQNWLYAMRYADSPELGVVETNDFRLVSPVEVQDKKRYQVNSWPQARLEPSISPWRRGIETELPSRGNGRTREFARGLFRQVNGDPEAYLQALLDLFSREEFFYTLEPPLLGDDAMDEFLFDTRRGFCEHYAAATAFMLRAVGVPSRVVAGYQGGEINPVNSTVIVHQFDAHAWNEVWFQGRGWVRVDPTAAIAPDRIEYGLEQAMQLEGSFLANSPLSPLRFRSIGWVNLLRLRLDAVTYSWQRFVLNYNSEQQYKVLNEFLGEINMPRLIAAVVGLWALILLPIVVSLMRRSGGPELDPATRLYNSFCRKLQRIELGRRPAEAPGAYAERLAATRPDLAPQVLSITRIYDAICYRSQGGEDSLGLLRRQVKRFNPVRR